MTSESELSSGVILSEPEIENVVRALANSTLEQLPESFIVIGLMDGAMVFAADLLREYYRLGRNPVFESLSLTSYGDEHQSSGRVVCLKDITRPIKGEHILIIDDVYETGLTLDHAKRHIANLGAASVTTCVFAQKPHGNPAGNPPEFVGWQAPDKFLVGYGLDDKGKYRGQPFISAI